MIRQRLAWLVPAVVALCIIPGIAKAQNAEDTEAAERRHAFAQSYYGLRYTPGLDLTAEGRQVPMPDFEFDFFQFVIYPRRLSATAPSP
jgi:hypothetical protein